VLTDRGDIVGDSQIQQVCWLFLTLRSLRLMAVPVSLDSDSQNPRQDHRPRKPLVDHCCHLSGIVTQRGRTQLGEANLLECDLGEVKHLCSSRLMLSVHPLLEVLIRRGRDALLRFGQQVHPLAEDYCPRGAHCGTGGLLVLLKALIEAELALDDLRIPTVPLELWHLEWAGHLAVAAADAQRAAPRNGAPLALLKGPERAARRAGGIEAVHALPFDVGEVSPIRILVELDDVFGLRVEI